MARMSAWPTYKSASMHVWQPESSKAKPASAGLFASVLHHASSAFVSGFSGGRVKQHPIANPNRHGGEAFGVRTTWGWVQ